MKKQFIITALTKLKANQAIHSQLMDLGIDCTTFFDKTGYISLVEEAIATMLANGDDNKFEVVLAYVHWWLTPNLQDVIYYAKDLPKVTVNVERVDDFVNWLFTHYEVEE